MFDIYDKIIYLPSDSTSIAAKKFNCIYKKLTENPKFKSLFIDVFDENQDIDVTIKFNENPDWSDSQLAVTEWSGISGQTHMIIAFNKKMVNENHPLVTAQTIIHEAIHAYFKLKIKECDEGISIDEINSQELSDLLNNYDYTCGYTDQHTLMYQNMIPVMKDILNDMFSVLVAPEDISIVQNFYPPPSDELHVFNWDDALYFMTLGGLEGASEFNATTDLISNSLTANYLMEHYHKRINNIFAPDLFNHSTCDE